MRTHTSRSFRSLLAVLLLPIVTAGCSRAAEEAMVEAQPAPGEIRLDQRGALTVVDIEVDRLANATEVAFSELGIAFEEREMEDDGVEMQGKDGDRKVSVYIEREDDAVLTEIRVSVTRDGITFDQARSSEILRTLLARAR